MFSELRYGTPPALDSGTYYRLLYEADVRPELLDFIGKKFEFLPAHTIRSLHEGLAIRWVNREVDRNYSVSTETEREVGDTYVLIFAAVALQRYTQLVPDYRDLLSRAAADFATSLRTEGFSYRNGHILDVNGNAIAPVPLDGGSQRAQPSRVVADENRNSTEGDVPSSSVPQTMPLTRSSAWNRGDRIAFGILLFTLVAAVAAWLVVPEVRRAFHLDNAGPPDKTPPVAITPENPSNTQGQKSTAPIFSVSDTRGKPVGGADILVIKSDGTHLSTVTDERGSANLKEFDQEPVTVFCAHPGFSHYSSEKIRVGTIFKIELRSRSDGGSVIFPDGTGYVPGLDGRLNPILDAQGRTYLYAENIAIEGGEAQPVPFTTNRPFNVRDRHGNSFELDIINIVGSSSLIDYGRR